MKCKRVAAAVVGLAVFETQINRVEAVGFTFDSVGDSVTFNYSKTINVNGTDYTLTGTTIYTATALTANSITLTTVVTNTSSTGTNQGIHSIGFVSTTPQLQQSGSSLSQIAGGTGTYTGVTIDTTFPGFQSVEMCAWVGNNCSGGSQQQAVKEGQFDNFSLTLAFASSSTTNPISFAVSDPVIRFKGDLGSFTFGACENGCSGQVPVPSSAALIGAGMVACGLVQRRQTVRSV